MTQNPDGPYLGDPNNLLTPEEVKALLKEAEDIRTRKEKPGLGYPPKKGYSLDWMLDAAKKTSLEGVDEKLELIYNSEDDAEKIVEGTMKDSFHSADSETFYQFASPLLVTGLEQRLAQELTAIHNTETISNHDEIEPATEYELRFTMIGGTPIPVRTGEFRELIPYKELDEDKQQELRDDFSNAGDAMSELMRSGEVAYAESVKSWEESISENREYDPVADAVVITDAGELSLNQFSEHVEDISSFSMEFAFEDYDKAPYSSQREFLEKHDIISEIEEYFEPVIGGDTSELMERFDNRYEE